MVHQAHSQITDENPAVSGRNGIVLIASSAGNLCHNQVFSQRKERGLMWEPTKKTIYIYIDRFNDIYIYMYNDIYITIYILYNTVIIQ